MKRIIKTAGQVAFEDFGSELGSTALWSNCSIKAAWEAFAAKHNIQPLTEEVADKPTDGELLSRAFGSNGTFVPYEAAAAEFLRLRAERDGTGEPLPVTFQDLSRWADEAEDVSNTDEYYGYVAKQINQHRGVRPVPQVTAEMLEQVLRRETLGGAAESLNAELAKGAAVQTVTPIKITSYVMSSGVLHTFEDAEEAARLAGEKTWAYATNVVGHQHHPRKA